MMRMKSFVLIISFLLSIGLMSCGGGKQKKTATPKEKSNRGRATGYAKIFDNDIALALDRAEDNAKNKLVRKILGESIEGRSVMENYRLVSTIVEARSSGLVKDIKMIKKWQEGTVEFVTIEGTVEASAVQDAIQDALDRYGRPKFMVLINETFEGKRNKPGFTETEIAIQDIMGDSGFEFVDAAMTQELMRKEKRKMQNAMRGRIGQDAQQLLLNTVGAEVLIVGTATTRDQSAAMRMYSKNMKSKSAIIRIKAIDVYTGRVLGATSKNAPGLHIEATTASKKAIENALKKILGKKDRNTGKFITGPFMKKIINKFVKAATQREINLSITGLDFTALQKFRNSVGQRIRGVSKVLSKGQIGKAANVVVYFAGKTDDFTQELLAKSGAMGFSITVKESFPNKVVMEIQKN